MYNVMETDHVNVSEYVYDNLRYRILSGEYKKGKRIPSETQLCDLYRVSRVTIRSAIHKLKGNNLLVSKRGAGTFVKEELPRNEFTQILNKVMYSMSDRVDMFEFRKIMEVESAGLAAMRADSSMIEQMRAKALAMMNAIDYGEMASHDLEFHYLVVKATGNVVLLKVFESLKEMYFEEFIQNTTLIGNGGANAHLQLCKYIETRDVEGAKKCMLDHLNKTIRKTEQLQLQKVGIN